MARARVLHREDVAAQRDAGRLERVDDETFVPEAAHDGAGRRGLAGVHARAGERDHRHAVQRDRPVGAVRPLLTDPRRHADALAEVWELEHDAEHPAVERLAVRRVDRVADAEHAAEIQELDDVAGHELLGQVPGVAEQRLAVPERADDDVAALDLRHAAARELERVVARLRVQHLDGNQHAFLARNLRVDADLVREIVGNGDGSDLVDDYGAHGVILRLACRASPAARGYARNRARRRASIRPRTRRTCRGSRPSTNAAT